MPGVVRAFACTAKWPSDWLGDTLEVSLSHDGDYATAYVILAD